MKNDNEFELTKVKINIISARIQTMGLSEEERITTPPFDNFQLLIENATCG